MVHRDRTVGAAVAVAAVVAMLVVTALSLGDDPPEVAQAAASDGAEAREELLRRFERMVTGTWRVEGDLVRVIADEEVLRSAWLELQRPPYHVVQALGGVSATDDSFDFSCVEGRDPVCRGDAAPVASVADTVAAMARRTDPDAGAYRVVEVDAVRIAGRDARCFELRLRPGFDPGRPGDRTEYCLTQEGLPLRRASSTGGADDTVTATSVSTEVSDAELARYLPAGTVVAPPP